MTVRGIVARRVMLGAGLALTLAVALCWPAAMRDAAPPARSAPLSLQHPHQREPHRHLQDGRRYDADALKQLNHFMRDWRRNKSREMDPELIDLIWTLAPGTRIEGAGHAHLGLPFRNDQQQARGARAAARPRTASTSKARQPTSVSRRSGEDAAQLGADAGMGRRRLLPDLRRSLRACRHRPRAHVAAHRPTRARCPLPQGPDQISAARRQADHPARYKLAMAKGLPGRNTLLASVRPAPKPASPKPSLRYRPQPTSRSFSLCSATSSSLRSRTSRSRRKRCSPLTSLMRLSPPLRLRARRQSRPRRCPSASVSSMPMPAAICRVRSRN